MMYIYGFALLAFVLLSTLIYSWVKMTLFQIEFEREECGD